ncbi:antitoxin [Ruminococcaceae bacterium OttesenSCG-928-O06]|nr:antitoxin [Ruminococcaceae bacterium OttesenSCG-928-O06]
MGKTSAESKNKYRAKAYDQINIVVPKGEKEEIASFAKIQGKSLNGFINEAIKEKIERDNLEKK